MTLDEVRVQIDAVDTQMKPLFIRRMECSRHVAEAKAVTGGDVFVPEREKSILKRRTEGVDAGISREYAAFLQMTMRIGRRYQYGLLPQMQEKVVGGLLAAAGLTADLPHSQAELRFVCEDASLFLQAAALNQVKVEWMELAAENGLQRVTLVLGGNVNEEGMRRLLCQIGKEARETQLAALR